MLPKNVPESVLDSLECKREGYFRAGSTQRRPVLTCSALPRCAAVRRPDPTGLWCGRVLDSTSKPHLLMIPKRNFFLYFYTEKQKIRSLKPIIIQAPITSRRESQEKHQTYLFKQIRVNILEMTLNVIIAGQKAKGTGSARDTQFPNMPFMEKFTETNGPCNTG